MLNREEMIGGDEAGPDPPLQLLYGKLHILETPSWGPHNDSPNRSK